MALWDGWSHRKVGLGETPPPFWMNQSERSMEEQGSGEGSLLVERPYRGWPNGEDSWGGGGVDLCVAPPPFPDEPMRQQCGVSGVLWEGKGGSLTIQGAGSCVTPPHFSNEPIGEQCGAE